MCLFQSTVKLFVKAGNSKATVKSSMVTEKRCLYSMLFSCYCISSAYNHKITIIYNSFVSVRDTTHTYRRLKRDLNVRVAYICVYISFKPFVSLPLFSLINIRQKGSKKLTMSRDTPYAPTHPQYTQRICVCVCVHTFKSYDRIFSNRGSKHEHFSSNFLIQPHTLTA